MAEVVVLVGVCMVVGIVVVAGTVLVVWVVVVVGVVDGIGAVVVAGDILGIVEEPVESDVAVVSIVISVVALNAIVAVGSNVVLRGVGISAVVVALVVVLGFIIVDHAVAEVLGVCKLLMHSFTEEIVAADVRVVNLWCTINFTKT